MLETQNLTINIGNTPVCQNLNITFRPGEIWGLIGRNGSGKTTLLHTLAGIIRPTSGSIILSEKALNTYSHSARANHIGLLPQENDIALPLRVTDAVSAGQRQNKNTAEHAIAAMDLKHLQTRLLHTLSGGEKRRCAIATLLAQTPSIYLLDEPLNHLDLVQQKRVMKHLTMLAKDANATIIMSLHDLHRLTQHCHQTLALLGKDSLFGKTQDLLNTPQVIETLSLATAR